MERNIHIDEFEEFLKEKSDQYKMYPSDKVWNNIHRASHPRKKWAYISFTILLLLGTAVFVDYNTYNLMLPTGRVLTLNNFGLQDNNSQGSSSSASLIQINSTLNQSSGVTSHESAGVTKARTAFPGFAKKVMTHVGRTSDKETYFNDNETKIAGSEDALTANNGNTNFTKAKASPAAVVEDEKWVEKVLWGGEAFKKSKFEWQLFLSPTLSYRKLTSGISEITDEYRGIPYSNVEKSRSVSNVVTHKPGIGAEVGANLIYKVSNNFLLRAGLQLNYSRYQLRAYPTKPELTTLAVIDNGSDSINVISTLQNFSGTGSSWLNNEYFQVSMPIGFELGLLGNSSTLKWNIAASAQPVYNFANNVYLLSNDFKRYGQDQSLIRKWNINAGLETYVSYNMGSFKWQAGPQLRYQLMSSYKSPYPVKEYLVDFGFKIGVTKTIR